MLHADWRLHPLLKHILFLFFHRLAEHCIILYLWHLILCASWHVCLERLAPINGSVHFKNRMQQNKQSGSAFLLFGEKSNVIEFIVQYFSI